MSKFLFKCGISYYLCDRVNRTGVLLTTNVFSSSPGQIYNGIDSKYYEYYTINKILLQRIRRTECV